MADNHLDLSLQQISFPYRDATNSFAKEDDRLTAIKVKVATPQRSRRFSRHKKQSLKPKPVATKTGRIMKCKLRYKSRSTKNPNTKGESNVNVDLKPKVVDPKSENRTRCRAKRTLDFHIAFNIVGMSLPKSYKKTLKKPSNGLSHDFFHFLTNAKLDKIKTLIKEQSTCRTLEALDFRPRDASPVHDLHYVQGLEEINRFFDETRVVESVETDDEDSTTEGSTCSGGDESDGENEIGGNESGDDESDDDESDDETVAIDGTDKRDEHGNASNIAPPYTRRYQDSNSHVKFPAIAPDSGVDTAERFAHTFPKASTFAPSEYQSVSFGLTADSCMQFRTAPWVLGANLDTINQPFPYKELFRELHTQSMHQTLQQTEQYLAQNSYLTAQRLGQTQVYVEARLQGMKDGFLRGMTKANLDSYANGRKKGDYDGYIRGIKTGDISGYERGRTEGGADGYSNGYAHGHADTDFNRYAHGRVEGDAEGYARGVTEGLNRGFGEGHLLGYSNGCSNTQQALLSSLNINPLASATQQSDSNENFVSKQAILNAIYANSTFTSVAQQDLQPDPSSRSQGRRGNEILQDYPELENDDWDPLTKRMDSETTQTRGNFHFHPADAVITCPSMPENTYSQPQAPASDGKQFKFPNDEWSHRATKDSSREKTSFKDVGHGAENETHFTSCRATTLSTAVVAPYVKAPQILDPLMRRVKGIEYSRGHNGALNGHVPSVSKDSRKGKVTYKTTPNANFAPGNQRSKRTLDSHSDSITSETASPVIPVPTKRSRRTQGHFVQENSFKDGGVFDEPVPTAKRTAKKRLAHCAPGKASAS